MSKNSSNDRPSERLSPLRKIVVAVGFVVTLIGVGDSLKPDTTEIMDKANYWEMIVFHSEGDAKGTIALGTSLMGGGVYRRKKKKKNQTDEEV